ncbi:MAG: SLC13 family permease, partial [Halorientalis sp.]
MILGDATGMVVVFGLILVALVLFVTEAVSSDITALGVLVALAVLEPVTGVTASEAISGFASPATVTIMAMYILSEGIQQTGLVERLGVHLARLTSGSESRLLAATVGSTGVTAGVINNTPVVAVFIPMITGLADRYGISPSKLLLPLSY